ncbi:hypothetical protein [uncultured Polaribacter sp.]|uniref:hypothetical protein n=1 Tax=uncultured Polaribacter sp. TaxID=174711 RepID=UPI00262F1224|nr:hypothetical protein [uncultured Polaribacter sp.]
MKAKWYLSTLLFISLCFGAFQEQVYEPNQEIVLEFVDNSDKSTALTINKVKEKLLAIGAINIKIKKNHKGHLKIGYYSTLDAEYIKDLLTEKQQLALHEKSKERENNDSYSSYKIDVYELKDQIETSSTSNDAFVIEFKYQSDRFTNNQYSDFSRNLEYQANQNFSHAFKISKSNPFTKDYTSHKEPEVRAGPRKKLS